MQLLRYFKKIRVKLITAFLFIGIAPLVVCGIITSQKSYETLKKTNYNQLINVRQI